MPIYEYLCEACGRRFDHLILSPHQRPTEIACPRCRSGQVRRLFSAPAIHTAGEGGDRKEAAEETPPPKPPVFGRKELHEILKRRESEE